MNKTKESQPSSCFMNITMQDLQNFDISKYKNIMKPYAVARALHTYIVRYVPTDRTGGSKYRMFHNLTVKNVYGLTRRDGTKYPSITLGCDHWDESGYCRGHIVKRTEFINIFCDGILPDQIQEDAEIAT